MSDGKFKLLEPEFNEAERKSTAELESLVRSLRNNIELHIELNTMMTRVTRAKYEALRAEGFTDSQALVLCK